MDLELHTRVLLRLLVSNLVQKRLLRDDKGNTPPLISFSAQLNNCATSTLNPHHPHPQ
jgi:hypothetical protein